MISIRRWWSVVLVVGFDSFSSLLSCSCVLYNSADVNVILLHFLAHLASEMVPKHSEHSPPVFARGQAQTGSLGWDLADCVNFSKGVQRCWDRFLCSHCGLFFLCDPGFVWMFRSRRGFHTPGSLHVQSSYLQTPVSSHVPWVLCSGFPC